MLYFVLKWLHLIGAAVLLGTGAGIAFFMLMAHLTRCPTTIAAVTRIVVIADFLFTATAVVAQPATGIALAAGTIVIALNAMRVGLLPRWMGFLGMFTGILIFFAREGAFLQIVPAFWMVSLGILFAGRWPNGEPPAWAAGEARPWPSQARGARSRARPAGSGDATQPATGADASEQPDATPAPAKPPGVSSARKRRRKRGARR